MQYQLQIHMNTMPDSTSTQACQTMLIWQKHQYKYKFKYKYKYKCKHEYKYKHKYKHKHKHKYNANLSSSSTTTQVRHQTTFIHRNVLEAFSFEKAALYIS